MQIQGIADDMDRVQVPVVALSAQHIATEKNIQIGKTKANEENYSPTICCLIACVF